MRLRLAMTGAVGALALVGAGAAAATVTYTPDPSGDWGHYTWFVGRGDVISNFGKGALAPQLDARAVYQLTKTLRCSYPDGSVLNLQGSLSMETWYQAQARHAPGSGVITGYFAGPGQVTGLWGSSTWMFALLVCPPPGGNPWGDPDPTAVGSATITGTISLRVNGRVLYGPEVIYGPVPGPYPD